MTQLRRLLLVVICAGTVSGGLLFAIQHAAIEPLIARAESYERGVPAGHDDDHAAAWAPSEGRERTMFTALGTVLTGIAFAAIALGAAVALGIPLDGRRGLLLGIIGFAAFVAAPSIGLPPRPPGVPGPDVAAAQAWWVLTVGATLVGLAVIWRSPRAQVTWGIGLFFVLLPHLIGAPAAQPSHVVPADLTVRFAWMSVATRLLFWLLLGVLGGHFLRGSASARTHAAR
jgi:cobalt transporter subunit CbtA